MSVVESKFSESDLEILETYLDGELPMAAAEGLWRRLAVEPELAAALDELRAQRSIRLALWSQMEPSDAAAAALASRVGASVRRRKGWEHVYQAARYVTAAAACLLIGFQVGWFEHGAGPGTAPRQSSGVLASDNGAVGYAVPTSDMVPQRPDSHQEATSLIDDLNNWQSPLPAQQPQQIQSRDYGNNVVPVSDEQF